MKKKKKLIIALITAILLFFIIELVIVEAGYLHLGFAKRVDYTNVVTPEEYGLTTQEIDLITSDNMRIHAYEVLLPNPDGIVIMLTGITGPSVTHFYGEAALVAQENFTSILIDTRGHGKSDGNRVAFAIDDVKDVQAVVDYINSKPEYEDLPIVIMGLSMGGATAINSASLIDDIDALITLSAFSSWTDVCVDVIEQKGWPRIAGDIMRPGIILHGFLSHGMDYFNIVPEKTIKQIGNKPILFIHNQYDTQVPIANHFRLMEAYDGNNVRVWIKDSWEHFIVNDNKIEDPLSDPEYCEKILDFIREVRDSRTSFFVHGIKKFYPFIIKYVRVNANRFD